LNKWSSGRGLPFPRIILHTVTDSSSVSLSLLCQYRDFLFHIMGKKRNRGFWNKLLRHLSMSKHPSSKCSPIRRVSMTSASASVSEAEWWILQQRLMI
jgi:hypothetical protein